MPYYIIIRGPLGSGKTTISKKLAQELDAKHFEMDEVLAKNGLDEIPAEDSCIPVKNFIKANEIILPEAKKLLANGQIIIFDACFYHKEVIENLVENLKFPHYIFTLHAPVELCIERDSMRSKPYGEAAARAVHALVARFDYGKIIDVRGNIDDTLKNILTSLPAKNS